MVLSLKYRILIVDDNEDQCNNLSDILELKGYQTARVYDGYQAIEAVKNNKFDAVLMDVKMPGLSGIETLKVLKKLKPDINVIMVTAFADDVFLKEGIKAKEFEIIQKPINIEDFLKTLAAIFSKEKSNNQV